MASSSRPASAGPLTVTGVDGLKEWNYKLGLIHLSHPIGWSGPFPKVGEVVPGWLRQLGELSGKLVTTIMWSNPHMSIIPNHEDYYEKGFFELPNNDWLIFSLRDGKRFACKFYPLRSSHHELFSGIGSLDVDPFFRGLITPPQAGVAVAGLPGGQPQGRIGRGQVLRSHHSEMPRDRDGFLVNQSPTTSVPYRQLIWQQTSVPADFQARNSPPQEKLAFSEQELHSNTPALMTNLSPFVPSVPRAQPSSIHHVTDHNIDLLSLAGVQTRRESGQAGAPATTTGPASTSSLPEQALSSPNASPAEQNLTPQQSQVSTWQHLSGGVRGDVAGSRTNIGLLNIKDSRGSITSLGNEISKGNEEGKAVVTQGSDLPTWTNANKEHKIGEGRTSKQALQRRL
ncbi:MAG: hypothetical protein Q9172_001938 [Xanthocarpia lactea]